MSNKKNDSLYVIFEHHLLNYSDSGTDHKMFIELVAKDYVSHLKRNSMNVVGKYEHHFVEEVQAVVYQMLLKKIYGFQNIHSFVDSEKIRCSLR